MDEKLKEIFIKIAGTILLSEDIGKELKKWREFFNISQTELAKYLNINPSTISDYETGRRKSPGTQLIKKIIIALLEIDQKRGGEKIKELGFLKEDPFEIIEFSNPLYARDLIELLEGEIVVPENLDKKIYGITIIDSIEAIMHLSNLNFVKVFGTTTERALLFTKITTGRSPMIAIRISNLKPNLIIFHNLNKEEVDELAKRLAKIEKIPLLTTKMEINKIKEKLKQFEG